MTARLMPQSLEAEASVLGALLLDRSAITKVADWLRPEDFYLQPNAQVYGACLRLYERAEPLDIHTVDAELRVMRQHERVGGVVFLAELQGSVPTAANVEHYGRLVKAAAGRRALIEAGTRIVTLGFDDGIPADEAMDRAQADLFGVVDGQAEQGFTVLRDALAKVWDDIEEANRERKSVSGIATGFYDLDRMTGGLQPGNLIILAARPGQGKTSWCLNVADHVAVENKQPVAIFSMEMSERELGMRLLCGRASVDAYKLRTGTLQDSEWKRLSPALGQLSEASIFIDETPALSVMDLRAKARRMKANSGLALVIVDYLQLMQGKTTESREREVAEISRSLKGLARELDVPIIACAQLNREVEKRSDHRPQLSDLRDSGSIEMDADLVIFLYREKLYSGDENANDIAEVHVAKHRNGPTGMVRLLFMAHQTRFANYSVPSRAA